MKSAIQSCALSAFTPRVLVSSCMAPLYVCARAHFIHSLQSASEGCSQSIGKSSLQFFHGKAVRTCSKKMLLNYHLTVTVSKPRQRRKMCALMRSFPRTHHCTWFKHVKEGILELIQLQQLPHSHLAFTACICSCTSVSLRPQVRPREGPLQRTSRATLLLLHHGPDRTYPGLL
jgi:hypothetical protein